MSGEVAFLELSAKEKRGLCPVPPPSLPILRLGSLLLPSIVGAIGFFCYATIAFALVELANVPPAFHYTLVIIGAPCVAFAAEMGTPASVVEVLRKKGMGKHLQFWDKAALVISICTTCTAFLMAFVNLLVLEVWWADVVRLYGPAVLALVAGLDSYMLFGEFGLALAEYDGGLQTWHKEKYEPWLEWLAGTVGFGASAQDVRSTAVEYTEEYFNTPTTEMLPGEDAPRLPGEEPETEERKEGVYPVLGGWSVACSCGWDGDKVYATRGYAEGALKTHQRHHMEEKEEGDF